MPLYMDRRDVPGASAADIDQAHVQDVATAAKHDVQSLTLLVRCRARPGLLPGKGSRAGKHGGRSPTAHGLIPNEIITVSEDHVLRFLGTMTDPVGHTKRSSSFRVILFTDLEGSTSMLQDLGQSAFMVHLTEHDLITRRALADSDGVR